MRTKNKDSSIPSNRQWDLPCPHIRVVEGKSPSQADEDTIAFILFTWWKMRLESPSISSKQKATPTGEKP
jgi:hypothetical protein